MSKTFAGTTALDQVSLTVDAGQVLGLIGENGSGKSTLIKCLAGVYRADEGEVHVDGQKLPEHYLPRQALKLGLAFMHQDLGLIATMSVLENLAMGPGYTTDRFKRIRWARDYNAARRTLATVAPHISPRVRVMNLSRGDQSLVALARVSEFHDARVVVFDEPTAALSPQEVPRLVDVIKRLTARGIAVIYVSHRLDEVLDLTDKVTVLRDGKLVGTVDTASQTEASLLHMMAGSAITTVRGHDSAIPTFQADPVLSVRELTGKGVAKASFDLHKGEILGVAGLLGAGRTELAHLLFGASRPTGGTIAVEGAPRMFRRPQEAVLAGIGLVPEDRLAQGIIPELSVAQNYTLLTLGERGHGMWLNKRRERRAARAMVAEYGVKPPRPDKPIARLSGGNQQKVVIAKWAARRPKVLILDEPTQGIDVRAKGEIMRILRRLVADGTSLIVIDSDFSNLLDFCDRILLMAHGSIVGSVTREEADRARLLAAAFMSRTQVKTTVGASL